MSDRVDRILDALVTVDARPEAILDLAVAFAVRGEDAADTLGHDDTVEALAAAYVAACDALAEDGAAGAQVYPDTTTAERDFQRTYCTLFDEDPEPPAWPDSLPWKGGLPVALVRRVARWVATHDAVSIAYARSLATRDGSACPACGAVGPTEDRGSACRSCGGRGVME